MTSIQHSVIGLPLSGKTTFLAALWHILNANEMPSNLALDKLVGNTAYLNKITEAWRKCEIVPRTSLSNEVKVTIHVKNTKSGEKAVLHFPDLSGESFELQIATRMCTTDYVQNFDDTGGILLFVTADREMDGLSINDITPLTAGEQPIEQPNEYRDWEPKMIPTQVCLVDLLQFLKRLPFHQVTRRIAVIVSAWDVIQSQNLEPSKWLENELPLLHQFLVSNPRSFEFRVYGVSAQGGDVTSNSKNELLEKIPSTRVCCVGPESDPHDLTSPIAWLMSSN